MCHRGKPFTALFKDSKAFFPPPSLPLTTTILPLASVSLSPFYSPCPNPLFMSLPLHLCGYMTHHTRLPLGFSVSFIPSLVSPSFFFFLSFSHPHCSNLFHSHVPCPLMTSAAYTNIRFGG